MGSVANALIGAVRGASFGACALAATTAFSSAHGQTLTAGTEALRVMDLDRQWAEAIERGNVSTLNRIFADDLVVISGTGVLRDKAAELKELKASPDIRTYFFRTEDVRVRVYGNAAVLTGLANWRINIGGRDIDHHRRYTSIFVRRLGSWSMVSQQISGPMASSSE